jgi:hypothetical protein
MVPVNGVGARREAKASPFDMTSIRDDLDPLDDQGCFHDSVRRH